MKLSAHNLMRAVLPLAVVAGSVFATQALLATRPVAPKKPREARALPVEVMEVMRKDHQSSVLAHGTVAPARSVNLSSEISGRVLWRHPQLTTGGLLRKGEILLKIDPRDYKLALAQQQAAMQQAQAEVDMEAGRRKVAEREWQMFGKQAGSQASSSLALREPQQRTANLGLDSARSSMSKAKLNLGRTTVRAPFDAVVREGLTETGRLVTPNQNLGTLVATDDFVVVVSLPVGDLAYLHVPGINRPPLTLEAVEEARKAEDVVAAFAKLGSLARVRQAVGDGHIERGGLVSRLVVDLDPVGRMARLLVGVDDPMGRKPDVDPQGVALPILLGAYVSVEMFGKTIEAVIEVPRRALHDGDGVYVLGKDNKLDIRKVKIIRRRPDSVLVSEGLETGDRLIISGLPSAVQGMDLKLAKGTSDSKAKDAAEPAGG